MARESQTSVRQVDKRRILAFGVVMLLIMLIASAVSGYLFLTLQKNEEDRLASTIGTILGESIARISFSGKYHSRLLLEEMQKKLPELAYISVETLDGRVEAHTESARNDRLIQQEELELSRKVLESGRTILTEKNIAGLAIKEVLLPYYTGLKPEPSGVIRIGIKVGVARDNQQRNLVLHLFMILILTVSAVWIMEILSRHFSKRLALSELALRESNELFTLFMKHSPFYTFIKEVTPTESRVLQASENFHQMIGISGAAMVGKTMEELFPADLATKITADDWAVVSKGEVLRLEEDFNNRNYSSIKFPINKGEKTLLAGYTIDITERKRAEEELRESKNLITSVIENIPLMIFLKESKDLRFVLFNHAGEELLGYDRKSLLGKNNLDLFPPEQAVHFMAKDREVLDGEIGILDIPEEAILTAKKGTRLLHTKKICLKSPDGTVKYLLGISEDITERKKHEKEILKIEKLESLGILAGGIAHDFNNILTGIVGNLSFAQVFLDITHKSYKPIAEAIKAAARAGDLAHQLLTFARGGEPVKKLLSVQRIVNENVFLALHGSNIIGTVNIPDSIHAVEADEGQMSQVLHNITINATQAMSSGGTLTVTAKNVALADNNEFSLSPGPYICLTISDQGCGMSSDILEKIFDPYFTTKSAGTGLGLASTHSIISRHGGYIGASSVIGEGTTFTIYLPSIGEIFSQYQTDSTRQIASDNQGGTILVMDDDEMIRNIASTILTHLGYEVTTCAGGDEAVELYNNSIESGTPFLAVIMDLTIPGGLGGKEAAEQILSVFPTACLIVSSGYSNDPIMSNYQEYGFNGAIAKPYNIHEVETVLNSLLTH